MKSWNDRLRDLRDGLDYDQDEMGAALGVSREWVSKLENGKEQVSELLQIKITSLERDLRENKLHGRNVTHVHTEESPDPYQTPRLQLNPKFAPTNHPTREQCLQYLNDYLLRAEKVPGALGHAWVQLQLHFPLAQLDKLIEQPPT